MKKSRESKKECFDHTCKKYKKENDKKNNGFEAGIKR